MTLATKHSLHVGIHRAPRVIGSDSAPSSRSDAARIAASAEAEYAELLALAQQRAPESDRLACVLAYLFPTESELVSRAIAALESPEVKARYAAMMAEPVPSTPEQFADLIRREYVRYEGVVKASGAKVD